jgi:hypothetical protein
MKASCARRPFFSSLSLFSSRACKIVHNSVMPSTGLSLQSAGASAPRERLDCYSTTITRNTVLADRWP